jgi:hypothetical protein
MPRSKYTLVPGPLPPAERIQRKAFRFDRKTRRKLALLLPLQLQQLSNPEAHKAAPSQRFNTLADLLVGHTEDEIANHLTVMRLAGKANINPANVRAAIRKLRVALKPFTLGWVDPDTAAIIPDDLDKRLADRARTLEEIRLPPTERRLLGILCQRIGAYLKQYASVNGVEIEERHAVRYIATALDYAGIEHSYSSENPSRFIKLVFPKD